MQDILDALPPDAYPVTSVLPRRPQGAHSVLDLLILSLYAESIDEHNPVLPRDYGLDPFSWTLQRPPKTASQKGVLCQGNTASTAQSLSWRRCALPARAESPLPRSPQALVSERISSISGGGS